MDHPPSLTWSRFQIVVHNNSHKLKTYIFHQHQQKAEQLWKSFAPQPHENDPMALGETSSRRSIYRNSNKKVVPTTTKISHENTTVNVKALELYIQPWELTD